MFSPEKIYDSINLVSEKIVNQCTKIIPQKYSERLSNVVDFALGIPFKMGDQIVKDIDQIAAGALGAGILSLGAAYAYENTGLGVVGASLFVGGGLVLIDRYFGLTDY